MKIDNSRIFTGDMYMIQNSTFPYDLTNEGDVFGSYTYNVLNCHEPLVLIYFKNYGYLPVVCAENFLRYVRLKLDPVELRQYVLKEERFIIHKNGNKFVKNLQPLFNLPGKTSLKELMGIQKEISEKNTTKGFVDM